MCHLNNSSVTIVEPLGSGRIGIPTRAVGRITLTTTLLPRQICLTAFGPHSGVLNLAIGNGIPAIHRGYYALSINGESYGVLKVSNEGSELIDASEIPQ